MNCVVRVTMNEFIAQKLNKSKQDTIYSPLTDDMEILECTPVKLASPVTRSKMFTFSRKLFSKNKSSRTNKNSPSKSKLGRIQTLFHIFQNKVQTWSREIRYRPNTQESKTSNLATPNRRVRYMLGRTPEQLYSPFCIETPPSHFKTRSIPEMVEHLEHPISAFHDWLTPPKRKPSRGRTKSKVVTNLF